MVALAQDLGTAAGAHEPMVHVDVALARVGGAEREADGDREREGLAGLEPERQPLSRFANCSSFDSPLLRLGSLRMRSHMSVFRALGELNQGAHQSPP